MVINSKNIMSAWNGENYRFSLISCLTFVISFQLEGHLHDHGGLSVVHISKHSSSLGAGSQNHGRLPVVHVSKQKICNPFLRDGMS